MQFSSIWPIDRTQSNATTLGQSGPGSDGIEGVLHILQSSSFSGTSSSNSFMSYPGQSLVGGVLPICRGAVRIFTSSADWAMWSCRFFGDDRAPADTPYQWWYRRCPWCNGYHCRKWTWWHEFKSWMRMIAFHIALILLGKVWIQLFSLQLWVNSRADCVPQPWWGN